MLRAEADVGDRPQLRAAAVGQQLLDDVSQLDLGHPDAGEAHRFLSALARDLLHRNEALRRR